MRWFVVALLLMTSTAYAQNEQTGDLNTSNQNSQIDSYNESNTTNYNGAGAASDVTPPPSAIAPSYISNGQDSCLVGRSIGTQVNVFGFSGGYYKQDPNCNRRRDAKVLKDLGMNIAAVALMCEDTQVWLAMFKSGTPCPIAINGRLVVGRAAYYTMKKQPSLFIPNFDDYKNYYTITLKLGQDDEETAGSNLTISERFRTSTGGD
jgi:hypothetical protein